MIPAAAMPVVRILRRDVKRPKELPTLTLDGLRWDGYCPMGLHPETNSSWPESSEEFNFLATDKQVEIFGKWWDEQEDARAAVNAVWPRKRRKGK